MKVGVARESAAGEYRVALVPETATRLDGAGIELLVESGAGLGASFLDTEYSEAGMRVVPDARALYAGADLVVKVQKPTNEEVGMLREIRKRPRTGRARSARH